MRTSSRATLAIAAIVHVAAACSDPARPAEGIIFAPDAYALVAPIASFDPALGTDLTGHRYTGVVMLWGKPLPNGQVGTFAELQLFDAEGSELMIPRSGSVFQRLDSTGRIILELVDSNFTFTLVIGDVAGDAQLVTGRFGTGGHISGPFTFTRMAVGRNTAPRVHAHAQPSVVDLTKGQMTLSAGVQDAEANVVSYSWREISGPATPVFEFPNEPTTRVTGLAAGLHEFVVVVTDRGGLTARDTALVFVYDRAVPVENEVVFPELQWQCPMGCFLDGMPNVRDYLAAAVNVRVFLRPGGMEEWIEAVPASEATWSVGEFTWDTSVTDGIWIYADDEGGRADLKIAYALR
jgi:hypothetical protein